MHKTQRNETMKPKYYLPFIPIIAIMFFLISVANAEYFSGLLSFSNNQRSEFPYVIAHRGASSLAPENTLAAINKAIELNADLIEIDVHLTRDGHPVVIHDKTVGRTTSGSGKVSRLSLTQLKQLDAGSWFGEHFKGEKIPTLEEVLLICQNRIPLLVELKSTDATIPTIDLIK
ncbi:MAG: glycerophosphodiester phosphodiesterase family protein [Bacillota bacterium]|nr:glycerophosphodiester phosphodiesterase family protein [Bacillota bacterium]